MIMPINQGIKLGFVLAVFLVHVPQAALFSQNNIDDKRVHLLEEAEKAEVRGNFKTAAKKYGRLLDANLIKGEKAQADVLVSRADALYRADEWEAAYLTYKKVITSYALYAPYEYVLDRLRFISERFAEGDASVFGFKDQARAIEIQELVLDHAPASQKAAADRMRLARLQYDVGLHFDAADTYREILREYPNSEQSQQARLNLARILLEMAERQANHENLLRSAEQHLQKLLSGELDPFQRDEAQLLRNVAHELQAKDLYDLGAFYLNPAHERQPAAKRYLNDVVREYPETSSAALAQVTLARLNQEGTEQKAAQIEKVEPAKAKTSEKVSPENMRPENVNLQSADKPEEKKRATVEKWLRPLEDLSEK